MIKTSLKLENIKSIENDKYALLTQRAQMVSVIKEMRKKGYANTTGIAVSAKVLLEDGNEVILSDRSGTGFRRCEIDEKDLIVIDKNGDLLEAGEGRLAPVNTAIALEYYKQNPLARACVHCHSVYSQVFAIANIPILPFTLQGKLTGNVDSIYVDDRIEKAKLERSNQSSKIQVPSGLHSRVDVYYVMEQVGKKAATHLRPRNKEMQTHGLGINHFEHGIFVFGRNLNEAYENLERIEANAQALLLYFGSILEVKKAYKKLNSGKIKSLNEL
jgi:ribulose-5-phosphate 4-epimerase/fuculose-1-phosphate aldolase